MERLSGTVLILWAKRDKVTYLKILYSHRFDVCLQECVGANEKDHSREHKKRGFV